MARLNAKAFENDEDNLPELCKLLQQLGHGEKVSPGRPTTEGKENETVKSNDGSKARHRQPQTDCSDSDDGKTKDPERSSRIETTAKRQQPLGPAHFNSLLLPIPIARNEGFQRADGDRLASTAAPNSPRRRRLVPRYQLERLSTSSSSSSSSSSPSASSASSSCSPSKGGAAVEDEEESSDGLSDFIVNDSASEDEELKKGWAPRISKHKSGKNGRSDAEEIYAPQDSNQAGRGPLAMPGSGQSVGGASRYLDEEPEATLKRYESIIIAAYQKYLQAQGLHGSGPIRCIH